MALMEPLGHRSLTRYAAIAVLAAIATIGLKGGAYLVTGSVAILSDALESLVNLVTSIIALVVLVIAARPADEEHAYGHTKAEYFASGFEGAMILFAALSIGFAAVQRLVAPATLESVPTGLLLAAIATVVNLAAARVLFRVGTRYGSIALEAGAHHLMVDVWTSAAVIVGVAVVDRTGWAWLDPAIALVVAANVTRTGAVLIRRSMLGLLDTALPEETRQEIVRVLESLRPDGVQYHALRTRQAGSWRFVSFHILVPGDWTVQRGHDLLERIEEAIRGAVPNSTVFTHLEPLEDPVSWQDTELRR
jgi:cation diffusion facilitator family transporter